MLDLGGEGNFFGSNYRRRFFLTQIRYSNFDAMHCGSSRNWRNYIQNSQVVRILVFEDVRSMKAKIQIFHSARGNMLRPKTDPMLWKFFFPRTTQLGMKFVQLISIKMHSNTYKMERKTS